MAKYKRQLEESPDQVDNVSDIPVVEAKPSSGKSCFGDGFKVLVIGCIIFGAAITIGLYVDIYYLRKPALHTAVVTGAPECTKIANNILAQTDNAIDATIGAMMCLAVIRPDQCSLASGGYMLIHGNGTEDSLDFQYAAPNIVSGGKSTNNVVAIPGLLAGLQAAHKKYGSLSFSKLVQPSIELAFNGFVVANSTAAYIRKLPEVVKKYFFVNGKLVEGGEMLQLTTLSQTLTQLINGNYSLAEDIVKTVTLRNGSISIKDFQQYKPLWKKPLVVNMRGMKVLSTDVPSTGVLLLSALNVLNEFPKMNASMSYAVIAEVLKVIMPKEALLQDPTFDSSQQNITRKLLSTSQAKYYASQITSLLNMNKIKVESKVNAQALEKGSSATVSVINLKGDAVSIVSSLGDAFGSKIITESGIILNDGLSMFSKNGKVNRMESFKRPLSYSSPAFLLNGKLISSFAPSADREGLASVIQVIKNMCIDFLNQERQSVDYPRLFYDTSNEEVVIEGERFSTFGLQDVVTSLKERFGKVRETTSIGSVNVAFITKQQTNVVLDTR